MIVLIFLMFVLYYIYVLFVTNRVIETAKKVVAGEIIVERGTPYDRFGPLGDNIYTCDIKRYFAYCGIKKGKIFITCVNVIDYGNGEVQRGRDWLAIIIEKKDSGEWEAVSTVNKP